MAELWEAELLDSSKRGDWNKHGGAKFEPFLVNAVAEITELWVENSKKISCHDVTSIREKRAFNLKQFCGIYLKAIFFISYTN